MKAVYSIKNPDMLKLQENNGRIYYGGDQAWYPVFWKRMAGCGPTTAANILFYLNHNRPELIKLKIKKENSRKNFKALMERTWKYITPGMQGVNSTEKFSEGMKKILLDNQIKAKIETYDVNIKQNLQTERDSMFRFLGTILERDCPVAFLNLDNGKLNNLESWHWVTLTEVNSEKKMAVMYDQGNRVEINLGLWLKTTKRGGGFVGISF